MGQEVRKREADRERDGVEDMPENNMALLFRGLLEKPMV